MVKELTNHELLYIIKCSEKYIRKFDIFPTFITYVSWFSNPYYSSIQIKTIVLHEPFIYDSNLVKRLTPKLFLFPFSMVVACLMPVFTHKEVGKFEGGLCKPIFDFMYWRDLWFIIHKRTKLVIPLLSDNRDS